ncbi:MAG: RidA family protein [Myxococcales bacterium]|nr:RidA family protein [Myxococcales bacterium]
MNRSLQAVCTDQAPQAIGPYSQAIFASGEEPCGLLFCSGQIALSPSTGTLVGAGDVVSETEQVMRNLQAVLAAAGCGFEHVVKTTIFLADMGDFAAVNEVYGRHLSSGHRPARATVQVAGLPRGARVEIDAIAVRPAHR